MARAYAGALAVLCGALLFAAGYRIGVFHEKAGDRDRLRAGAPAPPPGGTEAALLAALLDQDLLERVQRVAWLLDGLGPESLPEVRSAFEAVVIDSGDPEVALFAEWWARSDGPAAFRWAFEERAAHHPLVLSAVARTWARRDPEAAVAALRATIRDARLAEIVLIGVVRGWAEGGRPGLWPFLASLPGGVSQQRAIDAVVRRRALRDGPEEVLAWAETLPDDPPGDPARPKLNAMRRVAGVVAEIDPERAAAWAARHGEGPYGAGMYRRVATAWAERDGAASLAWLATLDPGSVRDRALEAAFRTWFLGDREAAAAWVLAHRDEDWVQPAIAQFALSLAVDADGSHLDALTWAERVKDEKRRREVILMIGRSWLRTEPESARAWLDSADLPDALRAGILQPPKRSRAPEPVSG